MRISDWSSDVCSSDLAGAERDGEVDRRVIVGAETMERMPRTAGETAGAPADRIADGERAAGRYRGAQSHFSRGKHEVRPSEARVRVAPSLSGFDTKRPSRSEEHTSELQSLMRISYAVFRLKKKTNHKLHSA